MNLLASLRPLAWAAILVVGASLTLTGCAEDPMNNGDTTTNGTNDTTTNGTNDTSTTTQPATSSDVRIIHASHNAPAVDVYVFDGTNHDSIGSNRAYGELSGFTTVPEGTYTLEVYGAGNPVTGTAAISLADVDIPAGERISVAIVGDFTAIGNPDTGLRMLVLTEGFGSTSATESRIRLVHAGVDVGTVGVDLNSDGTPEAMVDRFESTDAAGISATAGERFSAGLYNGATRVTGFTLDNVPANEEYILIISGEFDRVPATDGALQITGSSSTGFGPTIQQDPFIYVLHGLSGAGNVDVQINGTKVFTNVAYGELSGRVSVEPGAPGAAIEFTAAGDPAVLDEITPNTLSGNQYLMIASGELNQPNFGTQLVVGPNQFQQDGGISQAWYVRATTSFPTELRGALTVETNFSAFPALRYRFNHLRAGQTSPAGGQSFANGGLTLFEAGQTMPLGTLATTNIADGDAFIYVMYGDPALMPPADSFEAARINFPFDSSEWMIDETIAYTQ